jgi:hypothetical protein
VGICVDGTGYVGLVTGAVLADLVHEPDLDELVRRCTEDRGLASALDRAVAYLDIALDTHRLRGVKQAEKRGLGSEFVIPSGWHGACLPTPPCGIGPRPPVTRRRIREGA